MNENARNEEDSLIFRLETRCSRLLQLLSLVEIPLEDRVASAETGKRIMMRTMNSNAHNKEDSLRGLEDRRRPILLRRLPEVSFRSERRPARTSCLHFPPGSPSGLSASVGGLWQDQPSVVAKDLVEEEHLSHRPLPDSLLPDSLLRSSQERRRVLLR